VEIYGDIGEMVDTNGCDPLPDGSGLSVRARHITQKK